MKRTKFILISFLMTFALFNTSCKKDVEQIEDPVQVEESTSVKTVVEALRPSSGSSSSTTQNTVSAYFCFEFSYPISLLYNDGTTASISDDNVFMQAIVDQTTNHYIVNFVYPFDVIKDGRTITINNDIEFDNLVNSCPTINQNSGSVTQFFCFDFVYPVTLIFDDNSTLVVNDDTEFDNAAINGYNGHYLVNLEFPLDVTQNGTTTTINNSVEFQVLLDSCYNNGNTGPVYYAFILPTSVYYCITFNYPVTLVYNDGSTVVVNNDTEHDDALMNSTQTLYVVDYQYPLSVNVAGSQNVSINSINELYIAENDCGSGTFTASLCFDFVYPITLIYNDGTTLVVNDNAEMNVAFDNANNTNAHHVETFQYDISVWQQGQTIVIHNDQEFRDLCNSCNPSNP